MMFNNCNPLKYSIINDFANIFKCQTYGRFNAAVQSLVDKFVIHVVV